MKKPQLFALGAFAAFGLALGVPALAGHGGGNDGAMFQVTVTNLTRSQPFSPLLVATHSSNASVFTPGQAASAELALLAEDGDNSMLAALLGGSAGVLDVATGAAPIGPGASDSVVVRATGAQRFVSLAAMLVNTNDAFLGVDAFELSPGLTATFYGAAFDAGSEFNSEDCAYIPGPACGNPFAHDPTPAEGYVYVSNGIQGIGSLSRELYDWNNPVARIEITRLP